MKFGKYVIAIMLFVSLWGCGKKPVEYVGEGTEASDINMQGSEEDVGETVPGVPDKLNYTVQDTGGHVSYNVDARVSAEGMDEAGIYKMEFVKMDDAYLHTLSASVFDDEEYYIVKPYYASTMDELLEEQERFKEVAGTGDSYSVPLQARQEELEKAIASYSASNDEMAGYFGESDILHQHNQIYFGDYMGDRLYTNDLTTGGYTTGGSAGHSIFQAGVLRGEIDGELYELNACSYSWQNEAAGSEETYEEYNAMYSLTSLSNEEAICTVESLDDKAEEKYDSNRCNIDSAEQGAEHMLSVLGLKDFEKADTLHIVSGSEEDYYLDGYCFTYAYMLDGIMENYFAHTVSYSEVNGVQRAFYARVYVNSAGVAYVAVYNPIVLGEKQQNINMKSFSEIDETARQSFFKNTEYMDEQETCTIYAVKLMYALYSVDGVNYEIRPVWMYYGIDEGDTLRDNNHIRVITAVDAVSGTCMPGFGYQLISEYFGI